MLVSVDGNGGLLSAVNEVYFGVAIQRCWAHKTRNIVDDELVDTKDRRAMRQSLKKIWDAAGYSEARTAAKTFITEWGIKYPKAARQVRNDLDELLAFYNLDKRWWKMLRTTNIIERVQREIRRRFRPIDAAYNSDSLERIVFSALAAKGLTWKETKIFVEEIENK